MRQRPVIVRFTVPCTEILTEQTKGWVLSAATSDPAYELSVGRTTANLLDGYLFEEEIDDIITFKENGIMTIDPGTKTAEDYGYQSTVIANWNLSADQSKLNMQIPFFYDESNMMYPCVEINFRMTMGLLAILLYNKGIRDDQWLTPYQPDRFTAGIRNGCLCISTPQSVKPSATTS